MARPAIPTDRLEATYGMARERALDAKSVVVPTVVQAVNKAKDKSGELLDSDAALEARRRATAVVRAARGDVVVAPAKTGHRLGRWAWVAIGTAAGAGIAVAIKRMFLGQTPVALAEQAANADAGGLTDTMDVTVLPDAVTGGETAGSTGMAGGGTTSADAGLGGAAATGRRDTHVPSASGNNSSPS